MIMNTFAALHYCHYFYNAVHISCREQFGHIAFLLAPYILMLSDMHIDMRCIYYEGWSLWSCTTLPLIACSLTWAGGSPHQVWLTEEKMNSPSQTFAMIDNELMCILGTAQSCWNLAWRAPVRSVTNPLKTLPLAQGWDCLTYRFWNLDYKYHSHPS